MSKTVGNVIDRLLVQWLTPPDDQYAQIRLAADITDTLVNEVIVHSFTIAEDEALLRQGSIVEVDQELLRVVSWDSAKKIMTVTRGEYGTTPAVHSVPKLMNLNPPYTRASIFEAVADNIIQLYPKLFTASTELLSGVSGNVLSINDDLAVEITEIWSGDFQSTIDVDGRIVDYHPSAGGRAVITNVPISTAWVRWKRRFGRAEAETDLLEDLGLDERWVTIVMVGAAADLMVGRDIPAARTEWVKSVLEAENIRVGTRMSISGGLRQYRGLLLDEFSKEMKAEYRPKVHMREIGSVG